MIHWKRVALSALFCMAAIPAISEARVATITLGRDPEPPFCVMNPGGQVDIFWSIQHTTTPNFVRYTLQDPTRTITLETQTYPGNTGLNIARSWIVPNGLSDGKYWVRVEYWSFQASNEANAEVTFYVCSESGSLCAYKYEDANCNGVLDPTDPPVADWWICFETPEDDIICRLTDANGAVCLDNIPVGTYHVSEPPVPGWIPLGPTEYDVDVTANGNPSVTFLNVRENYCTGACCFPDGHCAVTTENDCIAQGGIYQGNNIPCDPNPCPQPPGACCFPDGHCEYVTAADCEAAGGTWYGYGSLCDPNPCPQPPGACCFPDGHCEYVLEVVCTNAGGTWYGYGSSCDPNPCPQPPGACCFPDGHCEYVTAAECDAAGGTWYGYGTSCDPNPCSQPPGACCFADGHCEYTLEENCLQQGGTWYGYGSVCDPNPCTQPPGACCFPDGHCAVLLQSECEAAGGTWYGYGTVCDPNPCPQPPGACCFPDGHCEYLLQGPCEAGGGTWLGYGTVCDPNPCPPPTGACCLPTGECIVTTESDCLAQNGEYQGNGTNCTDVNCTPVPTRNTTWGAIKKSHR